MNDISWMRFGLNFCLAGAGDPNPFGFKRRELGFPYTSDIFMVPIGK